MWHSKFCLLVEQGKGNSLNIESILGAAISDYSIPGGQERLRCLSVNQISCTFQLSRQPLAPWTSSELNIFNGSPEPFSTAVILSQEGSVTLFAKEIISGLVSYFLLGGGTVYKDRVRYLSFGSHWKKKFRKFICKMSVLDPWTADIWFYCWIFLLLQIIE